MDGWLIRITGWEKQDQIRLFAVAESDPRAALVAVQKATGAVPQQLRIESVGQLSSQTLHALGLETGQVRDLTP